MRLFRCLLFAVVIALFFLCTPETQAGNPIEKLGRGVANCAFGPLELIIKPFDINKEQGGIAAITYGLFSGIAYTVAREVVGVVDIVTFLIPLPNCPDNEYDVGWGYGPLMRPAWVVDVEHNAYGFFYSDDAVATGQ